MRRIGAAGLAAVAVVAAAGAGRAQAQTAWGGALSGAQQVPANQSPGMGTTLLTLSGSMLTVNVSWSGLTGGGLTGGHIHCCTKGDAAGQNVGIALPFVDLPASTVGSYTFTYNLLDPATYTAAFLGAHGGAVNGAAPGAFQALVAGLDAREAYVNLHNAGYPGGEIRANVAAVPEPSTLALAAAGLGGAGLVARRRRRA